MQAQNVLFCKIFLCQREDAGSIPTIRGIVETIKIKEITIITISIRKNLFLSLQENVTNH